jgi:hypothetical protein
VLPISEKPLPNVEGLNDVRTLLADFFSILLGIDQIVLESAYGRTLAFGPEHVESTRPLGGSGSIILTGHRDTHFRFLEKLESGDVIAL